ncbi:hypothetical protein [Halosimplex pelagicum]|uniref:HEAT repeat domain-containing protein n=1 Tax=Halosimplex pelagicum TaxID=869886 RepID=A0A7D5PES4_9EURY|nr:hypothetical protein [Halosimplex pelagicum]QLH82360.1 hypothetical protein HZS54_12360 [Halosimplex pelagicum]
MSLFETVKGIWKSDPASIREQAEDNPDIVISEIGTLEQALIQGDEDEQAIAADAIATGVLANTSVGETPDVFQVILQNVNSDDPDVRQPLVRALRRAAPVVGGDGKRQLLASSHTLARLLERDDQYTVQWVLPAVSRAVKEYPDPFLEHTDTIATGLDSDEDAIVTSAIETLATVAEQHYKPIKPHVPKLLEQTEGTRPYQEAEAMRTVALVAANAPSVIDEVDYVSALKTMHSRDEVIHQQFAVRAMGYLLSADPDRYHDNTLLPLVKHSLRHQNNHIQKDAAIACLRIIRNTDIDILSDPRIAQEIHYSIKQYDLRDQLMNIDTVTERVKDAAGGA